MTLTQTTKPMNKLGIITPNWPAPAQIKAFATTRQGGSSQAPYHSLNLGDHVGDDIACVHANRVRLQILAPHPTHWLQQVHGIAVADLTDAQPMQIADASISNQAQRVCAVMTADCLPVLFCDTAGQVVGAAHAGWRGLLDGVLEATVTAMRQKCPDADIIAWLGPAIGPDAFEVGAEVRQAFIAHSTVHQHAFKPSPQHADKWLGNLYLLARQRLQAIGIAQIYGGDYCTYSDEAQFFSFRRDARTGRMASLIWIDPIG